MGQKVVLTSSAQQNQQPTLFVRVYIYIYIHTHIYIYIYIFIYSFIYLFIFLFIFILLFIFIFICIYMVPLPPPPPRRRAKPSLSSEQAVKSQGWCSSASHNRRNVVAVNHAPLTPRRQMRMMAMMLWISVNNDADVLLAACRCSDCA